MNLKKIMLNERNQTNMRVHTIWFHLYKILEFEKLIYSDRKQISDCVGIRGWGTGGREALQRDIGKLLGVVDPFTILVVVMVAWVNTYTQIFPLNSLMHSLSYVNCTFIKLSNIPTYTHTYTHIIFLCYHSIALFEI